MVSFTSFVVLSVAALAQVASSATIVERDVKPIPTCMENFDLNPKNTYALDALVIDQDSTPTRLIADDDLDTVQSPTSVWLAKTNRSHGRYVTFIRTKDIPNVDQLIVRVDWEQAGFIVHRFFELEADFKCRVKFSAGYDDLHGAVYVKRQRKQKPFNGWDESKGSKSSNHLDGGNKES